MSKSKERALTASISSFLTVDCKAVVALRNVAGEGIDFAVGWRNLVVSLVTGVSVGGRRK